MRTLLTVTLNRRMLRGNWSSIRGAAPVGLGALGGHDARLQRLAGWLASSLAYSLCMLFSFHLSCILMIFLWSGSSGQEEGGWWRKHSNCCWCQKAGRRCQLLIIGRGGAFFPQVFTQINMQVNTFHEQRVKDIKSSHQVFLQEQIKFYQKVWK